MAKTQYKKPSPFYTTKQTSWFLEPINFRVIPRDSSDEIIVLEHKYQHRPDLLSYDLYGTPDYWWIFSVVNQDAIKDPIYDMTTGLQIYVPVADRLTRLMGN